MTQTLTLPVGVQPLGEVEFDSSHPLAAGCISYGVIIRGRPYDVKNKVWLQPAGTTGIVTTQQGLAATTSSGSGDLWTAKVPSYSMTGRNKASVWGLFYSTVSNNTIKRAIRLSGPSGGSVLIIDLGDSANNYLAGSCVVTGPAYPRRNDTAAPAANVLHNVLFTRNSTTQGLYRNGVEVGDANPTTSTANFNDNIDQIYIGNSGSAAPLQGGVIAWGAWNRDLSAADAALLYQNPRLLLRQRVEIPEAAGGGSSLDLTQTTGVSLAGTVATSGDIQIGTNFNLTQSSAVGLTGSLATTGDVQIGTTFNLAQTANVGLASSIGVSGDIQILSGSLDLTQTSAVAMSGTVGLSGDIQIGTTFNLAQTAAVGLTGSVATTGNIQIGTNFNLAQSVALAMSGSVAVTGDFQSGTAPVITQSFGNFGWDPRIRPSWKRKELREELEAALDDAPKAVQELVRVPGPDISEAPVREALEVVRTARKHRERAVTRQEIDELHEALETVATFTREREATRQARRRKQQHLLLLS